MRCRNFYGGLGLATISTAGAPPSVNTTAHEGPAE
jgi:hypothetical protein